LFGPLAGFLAAMALALTPIAVAVERSNNTDTWMMFTLLLAAWAARRAAWATGRSTTSPPRNWPVRRHGTDLCGRN
jgi:4-amino-4-deoxy-L-arabinose transferase-like glycosyltransferase